MKAKRAARLFSEVEQEKIAVAVKAAEMNTSGEIATMVVDRSDSYREAETLGAVLVAGLLALIVEVLLEYSVISAASPDWSDVSHKWGIFFLYGISIWTYIPMVFLLFFPSKIIFKKYPILKLPLVGRKRIDEAVRERAVRAFYEKGLYRTRDETGVLIFISLMERKVWILGGRGINRKIPHSSWKELARELSAGLRENKAYDALCRIIGKLGGELAVHFPKKADDVNELSDEVLT
jgi:putative membrane protein